uniref:Uncharacterized protein n=1 Tax=Peronospora matthiolae TaxID=2874970 RepID=A0AAV1UEI6_9STRA
MVQAPAVVEVSPARERSEATDDNIFTILVGLTERLAKLESSQRVRDEDEMISALLKIAFSLPPLAQNARSTNDHRRVVVAGAEASSFPGASTSAGRWRVDVCVPGTTVRISATRATSTIASSTIIRTQQQAGRMNYISSPTASQQQLPIRKFDGTELCLGLGSGFFDWGRTFLRAIKFAESS